MGVTQEAIHNALVFRDSVYSHRWYDAIGGPVTKYVQDFQGYPVDNTTFAPTEFVRTIVGASTSVPTDIAGGAMLLTTAGAEDDGVKLQLGSTAGESITFAGQYPCYFGCSFAISDVDQSDVLVGVCVTDTACLDAVTDGIYFRSIDESALLYFVTEHGSVEGVTAVATLQDAAYITVEWYFDGTTVYHYVNGVATGSVAATDATFPHDQLMRLTIEFLTGAAATPTCTIRWVRLIQIQE